MTYVLGAEGGIVVIEKRGALVNLCNWVPKLAAQHVVDREKPTRTDSAVSYVRCK